MGTYISNSIQFKIKSYIRLAELTDPSDKETRQRYVDKATELLEAEPTFNETHYDDAWKDDYRVGLIEEYLKGKSKVCIFQIWSDVFHDGKKCPPKISRKDSNEIAKILVDALRWERGYAEKFPGIGQQKAFIKRTSA